MSNIIKKDQTTQPLMFLMVDSTDHITGKTGLTPTVTISKNGGSFGSPVGTVSPVGNGWYKIAGNATDSNTLGVIIVHATATGADPIDREFSVVAFDPLTTNLGISIDNTMFTQAAADKVWDSTDRVVDINLDQDLPIANLTSKTTQTVGDALSAARADSVGKWSIVDDLLTLYGPDNSIIMQFVLNDVENPTVRLPNV